MYSLFFRLEQILGIRLPIPTKWRWKLSVSSEIKFWDNYFKSGGKGWEDRYHLKFDPNLEVQSNIEKYFPSQSSPISVLDVGAGPMTFLGKIHKGEKIHITATDPLANHYNKILEKYDIKPLVKTLGCHGEDLGNMFDEGSFDVAVAKNSIDHSYDPVKVILNMIRLARHSVVLIHAENEADNENWYGLHQWNFCCNDGDFIIQGKNNYVNFSKEYGYLGKVDCFMNPENNLLYTAITKA